MPNAPDSAPLPSPAAAPKPPRRRAFTALPDGPQSAPPLLVFAPAALPAEVRERAEDIRSIAALSTAWREGRFVYGLGNAVGFDSSMLAATCGFSVANGAPPLAPLIEALVCESLLNALLDRLLRMRTSLLGYAQGPTHPNTGTIASMSQAELRGLERRFELLFPQRPLLSDDDTMAFQGWVLRNAKADLHGAQLAAHVRWTLRLRL